MNRRDIFKIWAVVPAAMLPSEPPEQEGMTIQLPPVGSIKPGESITVTNMGNKFAVIHQ